MHRGVLTLIGAAVCLLVAAGILHVLNAEQTPAEQLAGEILQASGVQGGLIIHLNCGDGQLTAALGASEGYMVHGLDPDPADVIAARAHIKPLSVYGRITVQQHNFDTLGKLPYVENLVNLLVSEEPVSVSQAEILRVLAPNGVAYIGDGANNWTKTVKPRPAEIDDWTHHLYDASNNAVSHDTVIGPPRRMQWVGSPKWARHHDRMSSVSGYVSANGRNFYIVDEGSKVSPQLPAKWSLYARDAFSGVILWSRPIDAWVTSLWPFKAGPTQPARRLVAVGDRVYVTLGLDGTGLSQLDAVTGETLWTYKDVNPSPAWDTVMTEEIIYSDGVLFVMVKTNPSVTTWNDYKPQYVNAGIARDNVADQFPWDENKRHLLAIDAATGARIWQRAERIAPMTLAVDDYGVYFHDANSIACLDRTNGNKLWTSDPVARQDPMPPRFGPTLVVQDESIVFVGGDVAQTITGLSRTTGETLWDDNHDLSGHFSPYDLFMINGLAWTGDTASGGGSGLYTAWDPNSGIIAHQWPSDTDVFFMHQRCHRSKATVRYLIPSRTGIEFVDPTTGHWDINHWTRSGCVFGLVPSSGFVNITPHDCACYLQSKTFGFSAMAPAHSDPDYPHTPAPGLRTLPGPASGESLDETPPGADDWPTYRGDTVRSGYIESVVPSEIALEWETPVGGNLSTLTVANGRVFVASIDTHDVYALNEASGDILWTFTADGRVDSPPTIYNGRVIFGCADGFVYCLRASDGAVIWKFQAAPENLRVTSFEQVESVWPLNGSVLLVNDEIYCVAGRHMFLDGGLRFLRIDPVTGGLIGEVVLDENDPNTGENLQVHIKGHQMPVALPDILSSDREYIFMHAQRFDLEGNREEIEPFSSDKVIEAQQQYGVGMHLFSPTAFLDDDYMHRTYWVWGRKFSTGAGGYSQNGKYAPAGRVMAIGPDKVYGYGRQDQYYKWSVPLEYELFCAEKYPESESIEYLWLDENVPLLANSIVLTDKILWIAGAPDVVDEVAAMEHWAMDPGDPAYDPNIPAKLAEQDAALNDERGGRLRAVLISDGSIMADYSIESLPVWDGMVAANGRLYISLKNGKVVCFVGTNYPPIIDVGSDRSVFPMGPAMLDATVTDDGIPLTDPDDPCSLPVGVTSKWITLSGPGTVTFDDANSVDTTAEFSERGEYTLRLDAFDGSAYYYNDLNLKVLRPGDMDADDDVDEFDLDDFIGGWMFDDCGWHNDWCAGANQSGSGFVGSDSFAVMAVNWLLGVEPDAPVELTATSGATQISLDWEDNDEADLAGYNVYRSLSTGGAYTKINSSLVIDSSFIDTGAANLLTYFYVVTAVDDIGYESLSYSNEVRAAAGVQPGVKLIASLDIIQDVNDLVRRWNDQANSNDAIQSTGGWRPAYIPDAINGEPAIDFAGTGIHLDVADSRDINTKGPFSEKTLMVVFKTGADVAAKQVIWEQGGNKIGGLNFYLYEGSLYINGWAIKDDTYKDWGLTALNTPVAPDTAYVATMVFDVAGDSFAGFVDGQLIADVNDIGLLPTHGNNCAFGHTEKSSRFLSGGHNAAADFGGLIAEFYEYNAVLTTEDRRGLECFLMDKYDLAVCP